ncbi:MAG: type IV pilus secretin PilQ [Desulfatiglandaceae bacterium]|jgi:type IV pilus assembly protein PilQ
MCNASKRKRKLLQIVYIVGVLFMGIYGCASTPKQVDESAKTAPAILETVNVRSIGANETVVELLCSRMIPYTAFKLIDPNRVVMDVAGDAEAQALGTRQVKDGNVDQVSVEKDRSRTNMTRVVVFLTRKLDYQVEKRGTSLLLSLKKPPVADETEQSGVAKKSATPGASTEGENAKVTEEKPRIFFKAGKDNLTQILGVDFTRLPQGKSRLSITTSRKGQYGLERTGSKSIRLNLAEASIPPLLMRRLDSSYFEGAIERVKAKAFSDEKRVVLDIILREMVPFHIDQTDTGIFIDFGKTQVKPPEKRLVPITVAESIARTSASDSTGVKKIFRATGNTRRNRMARGKYTGAPMTMDFVNADVTNILRLIGEVSNLNIIWGPEVKGKVSMRLRKVPWDQALDLVLENNDLGKRREGNVIWITTKNKIAQIEAKEKQKREREEAERKKRLDAEKAAKADEPLVTEYLTINYVDVENIKKLISENVKGPRGKLSIDKANKTIIMTDTAANIAAARKLSLRQDRPTKQVMIEARIVEARTSFSRELGVTWGGNYQTQHNPWGGTGNGTYNYNFSTNFSIPSATTMGINFVNTAATKLLNAQIAFAETEGNVKTLSAPKIITRDTVKASIKQGTKIVLPSGTDSNGNKTYQQVDATLKLEVTPRITPNNMVIMTIDVSDDFPDYANARGDNVPINTKNAQTEMMIASGDTVVIGGIYKEDKSTTEEGTPWLRNMPILGWLFKARNATNARSELLIFLTPTVVSAPGKL